MCALTCVLDTLCNNDVVITSKRRHFDVVITKLRCFDVIMTLLLCRAFGGLRWTWNITCKLGYYFGSDMEAPCIGGSSSTMVLPNMLGAHTRTRTRTRLVRTHTHVHVRPGASFRFFIFHFTIETRNMAIISLFIIHTRKTKNRNMISITYLHFPFCHGCIASSKTLEIYINRIEMGAMKPNCPSSSS